MMNHPTEIVRSAVILKCEKCGSEANATCSCGMPYRPVEIAKD